MRTRMQFCTLGALTLQIELGDVDCAWCNTYIHVRIPPRVLHFSAFIIAVGEVVMCVSSEQCELG